jgi:hypothetical protein
MNQFRLWLKRNVGVDPKVSFSYGTEQGWIACCMWMLTWEGLRTSDEFIEKIKDELTTRGKEDES